VRLIAPDGSQLGIKPLQEALKIAEDMDLDLVEVAPQANPPVCKIMDYGKFRYEQTIKMKEARKKQAVVVYKEMKMRPKIDIHDYEIKKGHVKRFLNQGAKVKLTIMFRGREMAHTELGRKLLERVADDLRDLGHVESQPLQDGRNMVMIMAPNQVKPKKEQAEESEAKETE
jgi:translation initiation factor IF-3